MKTSFNMINRCLILLLFISGFWHLPVVQAKTFFIKTGHQDPEYTDTTRYTIAGKIMIDGNGIKDKHVNHTPSDPHVISENDPFVIVLTRANKAVYMQRADQFGNFKFSVELPGVYRVIIFSESWLRSAEIGRSNFQFDSSGTCKLFDYVQDGQYIGAEYSVGKSKLRLLWALSSQGTNDHINMNHPGEIYVEVTDPRVAAPLVKFGVNHYPTAQAKTQQVSRSAFTSEPLEGFPDFEENMILSGASSMLTQGSMSGSDSEDCPQGACTMGRTFTVHSVNAYTTLFYKDDNGNLRGMNNEPITNFNPARLQIYARPDVNVGQLSFRYSITDAAGLVSAAVNYVINVDAVPDHLPEEPDTTRYTIGGRVMIDGNGLNDNVVNHTLSDPQVTSASDPFVIVLSRADKVIYLQKPDRYGNFKFRVEVRGVYRVAIFSESWLRSIAIGRSNFQFDSSGTCKMYDSVLDEAYVGTEYSVGVSQLRSGWAISSQGSADIIRMDGLGEMYVYATNPRIATPLIKFGVNHYPTAQAKTQQVSVGAFSSVPAEGFMAFQNYMSISGASNMLTQGSLTGSDPEDCPQGSCTTGKTFSVSVLNASTVLIYKHDDGILRELKNEQLINFDPARLQIYGKPGATQLSFKYLYTDAAGFNSATASYIINTDAPLPESEFPENIDTTHYIIGGRVMIDGNGENDGKVNHTPSDPHVSSPGDPFVFVLTWDNRVVYMQKADEFGNFKFKADLPGPYRVLLFNEYHLRHSEIGESNFQFDSTGTCKMFDYIQGGEYIGANFSPGQSNLPPGWYYSSEGTGNAIYTDLDFYGEIDIYATDPNVPTSLVKFGINHRPTAQAKTQHVSSSAFSSVPAEGFPVYLNYVSISGDNSMLTQGSLSGSDPEDCPQGSCSAGRTFSINGLNASTRLYYKYDDGIVNVVYGNPIINFDPARLQIYGVPGATQLSFSYSFNDEAGFHSPFVSYVINTDALQQPSQIMRINAGGINYTTSDNRPFAEDRYYQGRSHIIYAGFNSIVNTDDPELYETGRAGDSFNYQIPVGNGPQKVILHFAELYWGIADKGGIEGSGKRKFNVEMEGSRKLTNYDIYTEAGGPLRPVQETFFVNVTDGVLNIDFLEGSANMPAICAIEVLPQQQVTLGAVADSYVRNGSFSADNYGQQPVLDLKKSDANGFTRYTYLKFPLDNVSSATNARLRIYGSNVENINSVTLAASGVTDDSWNETDISWNNAPASSAGVLGKVNVRSQARYYEIDVTGFVQSELAGDKMVSIVLKAGQNDRVILNSRENTANPPLLIITNPAIIPGPTARMGAENITVVQTSASISKVYPNPARKYLTIEPSGRHTGTIRLQLTALNGQTYQIQQPASGLKESKMQVELPSAYLFKGMYLLKIQSDVHTEVVKVFITD